MHIYFFRRNRWPSLYKENKSIVFAILITHVQLDILLLELEMAFAMMTQILKSAYLMALTAVDMIRMEMGIIMTLLKFLLSPHLAQIVHAMVILCIELRIVWMSKYLEFF